MSRLGQESGTFTKLLKYFLFACFPVSANALVQHAFKLHLGLAASFFDGGYDTLLMRMSEVPRNVRVVQRLEWRKGGCWIEGSDLLGEGTGINLSLSK
jgi:hypothetical protein